LRLSHATPLYVVEIQAKEGVVIVGPYSALEKYNIYLNKLNIVDDIQLNKIYTAKIRSTGTLLDCYIRCESSSSDDLSNNIIRVVDSSNLQKCRIELVTPDFGIAPGQVCIVYCDERVIMSGTIYKKT
ncbi:MAG: aminomethyltransferase beta-barrel domain-containing protein, partial [Pseudomonadota bacterium]